MQRTIIKTFLQITRNWTISIQNKATTLLLFSNVCW